jgi:hypothetical protein
VVAAFPNVVLPVVVAFIDVLAVPEIVHVVETPPPACWT